MKNIHSSLLSALLLPLLCAAGCSKETAAPCLSVDDTFVTSVSGGGRYTVGVHASGGWHASIADDEVDWVSIETASGNGDGEIVLLFEENSGLYRFTELVLSLDGGGADDIEIYLSQESSEGSPVLVLLPGEEAYPAAGGVCTMAYSANVPTVQLSLRCSADWVSGLEVGVETVSFTLDANPIESVRRAELFLVCTDAQGTEFITLSYIVQDSKGDRTEFEGGAENDSYRTGDNYKW